LSKVPSIDTDASTANLTLLSTGAIAKTGTPAGACAKAADENKPVANKNKTVRRMLGSVRVFFCRVNQAFAGLATFASSLLDPVVSISTSKPRPQFS
jgi:hypothetical protein